MLDKLSERLGKVPSRIMDRTAFQIDPAALTEGLRWVLGTFDLTQQQICITARPGATEPLWDGVGRLADNAREADYTDIVPEFRGTPFETFVRDSPFRLGRVRIMAIGPRSCYSFHNDNEPRLHVALQTNPGAVILLEEDATKLWRCHVPANGFAYWIDTRRIHTAMNTGLETRYHLVGAITQPA